ncbi:MAG: TraR/DksA C4-type zinc finger protein [Campylobacterales bacterium]|nr:TraR/DksA C4-type zinc finger protein [Campylobacterales bacterium]
MNKKRKEEIFSIIEKQIFDLELNIERLKDKIKPVSPDVSLGRLTRQEAMQEQELNKKLFENSTLKLTKLKYAKNKVFTENFGNCDICDEEIDIERLKIMPETVICMNCLNEKD